MNSNPGKDSVYMIGPYIVNSKGKNPLILWCVTIIDPATSSYEDKVVHNREEHTDPSVSGTDMAYTIFISKNSSL
jgi:hypothetical protein